MQPSPYHNDILVQPERSPVTNPLTCGDCGAPYMTAFGYVGINNSSVEEKPMIYFADWVPGHVDDGITLMVGIVDLKDDAAVNVRGIAFSLKPWKDGWNIELVDAGHTLFANGLRHVFSELSSVAEAKQHPELELYHSIALRVLGDEPRFKPFLMSIAEKMS